MIESWVAAGTPEGDPGETPALPAFPDGWLLGTPDLVVTPPESFTLPADPNDAFRIFAIPLPVSERTYVRGIEFHPGNPRVVHHANIRVDRTPASRQLDAQDPLPGYDGLMPRSAEYPDGRFLGRTPGQVAPLVAPDLAWTLEPWQRPRGAAADPAVGRGRGGAARHRPVPQPDADHPPAQRPAARLTGNRHPGG